MQIYISVIKSLRRQRRKATVSFLASKCVIIKFINIIMNVPSAMLPRVPNLFSRFRRRGAHSPTAQVLGGVRDRRRRRSDRFASGGVFYLAGSSPDRPRCCCLLDPHAPLAVSQPVPSTTSTFSPPRQNSTGYTACISCSACIILSLISILG